MQNLNRSTHRKLKSSTWIESMGHKFVRPRQLIIIFLGLAVFAPTSFAQLLNYGTFSGYGIGKGILGNDYTNPLAACITGSRSKLPASQSSVRASIVYNANQYEQAFHIDQNAKATFLGIASGSDQFNFGQETSTSGSAFDIILEAYSEADSDTIDDVKWNPPYDTMVQSGNPGKLQQVRMACGDRYIETVFNEARIFAVLHVSSRQVSSLTQFSLQTSGSADVDLVSASGALGGDANIKSANQSGAITIDIYTEGIGGLVPTASAVGIASSDGLSDIASKLAAWVHSLTSTGQPVKYQLAQLPGIETGNLTDVRIFSYLATFKEEFNEVNARLSNIDSLLGPDARRIVFREPQADVTLRQQKALLTTYDNEVAAAHDECRKASLLSTCVAIARNLSVIPPPKSVELSPITPPYIGAFIFAIDGVPISPGQSIMLFESARTLLDGAKTIVPAAQTVDVLAPINDAYLSSLTLEVQSPHPPYLPVTVGSAGLRQNDLLLPSNWKKADGITGAIVVLHGDIHHPCPISIARGLGVVDESCLTTTGQTLVNAALADAAEYASANVAAGQINFSLIAPATDCFNQVFQGGLASIRIDISRSAANPSQISPG